MTHNVTKATWSILEKDLIVQDALRRKVINIRALAKHVIKEHSLNASMDSVISAIRRYKPKRAVVEQKITPLMLLKDAKVSTRSNVACISIKKAGNISLYLEKLSSITETEKEESIRIIKADKKLKIITDTKNINDIVRLFNKDILEVKEGLSEVSLSIGMEADDTRGVLAQLGTEMLLAGVNICEIIWCIPEILIYINKDDLIKVHEKLLGMTNQ